MNEMKEKCILIIEDNPSFLKMLKLRLESNGYKTLTAMDGLAGLNTVRKEVPDLVILDIMLPVLDGHKVCRMIKFDKKLAHIPVIVFTSRDLDADADLAKQCRADAFIVKTTKAPIILEVIQKLLDKNKTSHSDEP